MNDSAAAIWLLLDSSNIGGIETHVVQLAAGLKAAGRPVTVVLFRQHAHNPLQALLQQNGIDCCAFDGKPHRLWHLLRSHAPGLLHTHGYKAGIVGRCIANLLRIPVVSSYHAGEVPNGRVRLYDALDRYTGFFAQARLSVSREIQQRLPWSSRVLDNFIDTDKLTLSQGQQIAFVGRLSSEKGPDRLLQLAEQMPATQFHCYGTGPLAATIQQQAPDNLILHGMQSDMAQIWPRIGLLLMPSRYEGLPMAALEAMGRGIPVLATRVGDLPRVIDHHQNGWLVEQPELAAMQQHVQQWLSLAPTQRADMQRSAAAKIEQQFSAKAVIPQLLAIYWQIAKPVAG
ncbi:glycosyltransferase [Bacterioplanes sanyensis]|uniref:Glycosyltransferase n=1 Tax=Bacterioplanes sanyensis TaxID=1249553 RepID=A0A222FKW9_9GAMM|nr:glycosyltransferase family 4 protein [Bacterioplanes sanyensis]ASP39658.1 glycosyltransferase [Bacterioplanes sanyensis]